MGDLQGKTALVTGSAKRIGRGIALALAGAGANVVVHHNVSSDEAGEVVDEIRRAGAQAWPLRADFAEPTQAQDLVAHAVELAGPLDVLVNNASVFTMSELTSFTAEDLEENIRINALAPLVLCRAFAAQDRPGHIVNLLDSRVVTYDAKHVAYHLSKRVFRDLTRIMAIEFAPRIAVNAVAPGLILPPPGEDDSFLDRFASSNPLKRAGSVEEVAEAVLYLLRSEFVTGQVIFVDGGCHMEGSMYG